MATGSPTSRLSPSATTIVTYAELAGRARLTAGALAELGVGRGDVVGALLHNSLDFVEVMLGADYLGAVFMPLNWRLTGPEISYIVGHADSKVLVSEPELEPLVALVRDELECRVVLDLGSVAAAAAPVAGPAHDASRGPAAADVYVGHDRAAEGRHDHPRESRREMPRPHRRARPQPS